MPSSIHKSRSILFSLSALILVFISSARVLAADVTLSWDPKTDAGLSGYKLYYGTASRAYSIQINVGNITTYTVTGLGAGTYYFAVTANYTSGTETGYSNEVSSNISATPAPLPAPTNLTVK